MLYKAKVIQTKTYCRIPQLLVRSLASQLPVQSNPHDESPEKYPCFKQQL